MAEKIEVSYNSNNGLLTPELLKSLFEDDEIYEYTVNISKDYKDFKDDAVTHLKFLQKQCDEGLKNNNIQTLNAINNFITSFLIRNDFIENN